MRRAPAVAFLLRLLLPGTASALVLQAPLQGGARNDVAEEGQTDELSKTLRRFIQNQKEGWASLVLMGDSTVNGALTELLKLVGAGCSSENDNCKNVYLGNDMEKAMRRKVWVQSGGEWFEPTAMDSKVSRLAVERSQAATAALHARNCSWSGRLETYVLNKAPLDGLVVYFWGYLPELGNACWDACMTEAMAALRPSAMMWNIGFHLLQREFDKWTCERRHPFAKKNCGNYEQMVSTGMRELAGVVPKVVWRTTNWLCEKTNLMRIPYGRETLAKWHDPLQRQLLEEECHRSCPGFGAEERCGDWLFDSRATERLYNESMSAIRSLSGTAGIHVLDAFKTTRDCCERGGGVCKASWDGEHYDGLDRDLLLQLAHILAD
eukprot:TRINITY_DN54056_c0_g1_i1.p1 TRINITY_DN54056_c0_g1~~TRINITY_DN54056_c0_g1_i1.p1  ORF type:complete len:379 (-),score=91.06 TRINITY_DN54056_c0_g1_i1:43-1179(-)